MSDTLRVLHVDDEPDFADLTATFLERENERLEVKTALDAEEGLECLAHHPFDCIVSDYDMPSQNGIEFLKQVRDEYPSLPFILFTGKGSEEVASEAISVGVTDYLQKETGTDQYTVLANRIDNAVSRYRAEERAAKQERILRLLREVNQTLVSATTRAEIEEGVTSHLASTDPYTGVWMGEYDHERDRIMPNTVAGLDSSLVSPTALPEAAEGTVPSGVDSHEITVAQWPDPTLAVWDTESPPVELDAVALLPLVYHGEFYGLLALYSAAADQFDEDELGMLEEMAGDIGQALHVAKTRETLKQHQTAVEAVPEGVFVLDEEATIHLINQEAASLINRTPADLMGVAFPTFVEEGIFDEAIIDWYLESVRDMLSSSSDRDEARYETEVQPVNGPARRVEIHLTLRPFDEDFRGTVGVIRDVN